MMVGEQRVMRQFGCSIKKVGRVLEEGDTLDVPRGLRLQNNAVYDI